MKTPLPALLGVLALSLSSSMSLAQKPFMGNTIGVPSTWDFSSDKGTIIYANSDGSSNINENIYFKVYEPGKGSDWRNSDWYSNPTAWLDPGTFHFNNVNLKMYKNSILLNKGGVIDFGTDQVKEPNAGTISYGNWAPGLNIVGGNTILNSRSANDRRVVVFAEAGTIFNGPIGLTLNGAALMTFPRTLSNGADVSTYRLFVEGGILAKEVRVNTGNWADYVFSPGYKLKSLADVEAQIHQLGHLPGMPSAKEIEAAGFSVGEMTRLQQEKIEELTLYIIALEKKIDRLTKKVSSSN